MLLRWLLLEKFNKCSNRILPGIKAVGVPKTKVVGVEMGAGPSGVTSVGEEGKVLVTMMTDGEDPEIGEEEDEEAGEAGGEPADEPVLVFVQSRMNVSLPK